MVTSILNHKGGVGKTTTTLNLGKALSLEGFRVLLIDIDPQANLSQHVGVEEPVKSVFHTFRDGEPLPIQKLSEKLFLAPSDLELVVADNILMSRHIDGYYVLDKALEPIKNEYDFILIDCPPSLGALTNNALIASDNILIPLEAGYLAMKGIETIMGAVQGAKRLNSGLQVYGILLTKVENTVISKSIIDAMTGAYPELVYSSQIRKNVALPEASSQKTDVFTYAEKSSGAQDYRNFCKEFLEKSKSYVSQ